MESVELNAIVQPGNRHYLLGQATVSVHEGRIHILGKYLGPEDGPQLVVSPPSTALLHLENFPGQAPAKVTISSVHNGLERLHLPNGANALGLAREAKETFVLNPLNGYALFDVPEEWWSLSSNILSHASQGAPPIILIAGPRKVGKSTLCRFLVNQLLNVHPSVAHMDLDLGQTEFNPPGFLSLHAVKDALLGPPLRHAGRTDHSCYLGFTDALSGPRQYLECAGRLIAKYEKLYRPAGMPLVINTMGWTESWGLELLKVITQSARPTHVIAIRADKPEGDDSVPDYLAAALYEASQLPYAECVPYSPDEPVYVDVVRSAKGAGGEFDRAKIDPRDLRSLVWLSYFFQDMTSSARRYDFSRPLSLLTPYRLSCKDALVVLPPSFGRTDFNSIFGLMNLAVVGLAPVGATSGRKFTVRQNLRIHQAEYGGFDFDIHGAAIVRGVDPLREVIDILTPIPLGDLIAHQLFTLVLRAKFYFPDSLVIGAHDDFRNVPYLSTISSFSGPVPNIRRVRNNIQRRRAPQ